MLCRLYNLYYPDDDTYTNYIKKKNRARKRVEKKKWSNMRRNNNIKPAVRKQTIVYIYYTDPVIHFLCALSTPLVNRFMEEIDVLFYNP